MKFTGNRAQIANAAKWVARAIPRNPSTPILAGMLLEATEAGLRLSAFDYDLALSATVEGVTLDEGRAVVPGLVLAAFLSAARGTDADFVAEDDLTVRSGSASSVLRTLDIEQYPSLPAIGSGDALGEASAEVLADVVGRLSGLASREDTVPWEMSALLVSGGDSLAVTIGSRYALGQQVIPSGLEPFEMVLPAARLSDALGDLEGAADLYQDGGSLGVVTPTRAVSLRQFDAKFPGQVNNLIYKTPYDTTITVDREALASALKLTASASDRVQLSVDNSELTVASYKPEKGEAKSEITDVIPCESDRAGDFRAAHKYLGPILAAMTGNQVQIRFSIGSNKAITATDGHAHFAFQPTRGI